MAPQNASHPTQLKALGTCHVAYTICYNIVYPKHLYAAGRCDTETPASSWSSSWRPGEIPHNAYNSAKHPFLEVLYLLLKLSELWDEKQRTDEHLGKSVKEIKAGRIENSHSEFYLDKEVENPFLLQKVQRSLETTSDGESVSVCFSPENTHAQAVPRDIRQSVTSVLTRNPF